MSEDILAAFGDSQSATKKPQTLDRADSKPGLLVDVEDSTSTTQYTQSRVTKSKESPPFWTPGVDDTDVLFDATKLQEDDEDDFGDFEDVTENDQNAKSNMTKSVSITQQSRTDRIQSNTSMLLGVSDSVEKLSKAQLAADRTLPLDNLMVSKKVNDDVFKQQPVEGDDWGEFEDATGAQNPTNTWSQRAPESLKDELDFEDWQPFDDEGSEAVKDNQSPKPHVIKEHHSSLPKIPSTNTAASLDRPTNVPPPAILLELLPSILQTLSGSTSQDQLELEETASKILIVHRVSARIIAGRSLRWKRDTILAQSTRMSQAGKTGGMKLTAVNKGESVREEREAAETIMAWSRYVHKFNSIFTKAKFQHSSLKLTANMPVKTATGPGIIDAPNVCPICGLKRTERVVGVDTDITDIFNEFWIQHWGHKECLDFWTEYKALLGQR